MEKLKAFLGIYWRFSCFSSALYGAAIVFISAIFNTTEEIIGAVILATPFVWLYNKFAQKRWALMTLVVIDSFCAVVALLGINGLVGLVLAFFAWSHLDRYYVLKTGSGLFAMLFRGNLARGQQEVQKRVGFSVTSVREAFKNFDELMHAEDTVPTTLDKHRCLNCGCEYEGNYCPYCRQDNREGIDWYVQLLGMLSDAINFEGTTIRTLYLMLRCPGEMLHNYIDGKRKRYSDPVKFVAFSALAFAFMSIIFPMEISNAYTFHESRIDDVFKEFTNNIVIFQCILLFVIELTPLYWAFRSTKVGRTLQKKDFYTILLYMIGMDFWLRALMSPLTSAHIEWNLLRIFLMFVYQFVVIRQFFSLGFFSMVWRYICKYLYYALFLLLTFTPFIIVDSCRFHFTRMPMTQYLMMVIAGEFYPTPDVAHTVYALDKHAKEDKDSIGATSYTIEQGKVIIVFPDSTFHVEQFKTADIQDSLQTRFWNNLETHKSAAQLSDIYNLFLYSTEEDLDLVVRFTNPTTHISADALVSKESIDTYLSTLSATE